MHRFTLKIYFVFAFLFFGYARLFAQEFPTIDRVLYVKECVKEITIKAGQKCTAVRRIIVPENLIDDVQSAISSKLEKTKKEVV